MFVPEEDTVLTKSDKPKTYIDIPQSEFFFDILIWIYSKDSKRLLLTANEPENYLSLLTLGIYLELCDDFFNCLIEKCEIKLDEKLIKLNLWSRFCFNFEVLIHLIELIPKKNYLLIFYALLSWLKEDNSLKICNENDEIVTDLCSLGNYAEKNYFAISFNTGQLKIYIISG